MATIKVKFRPSTVADHEGTIYYQILHERKQRQLFSNYHIYPYEWDDKRCVVASTQESRRRQLTMYVARHSWASAAKMKGIPLSVISEGMGHDSETTQIYLASLNSSVVDKANSIILEGL